jgi:muramoyltetrapeptide carboxypeptidase LdcA involved in peptidoglycan recycling
METRYSNLGSLLVGLAVQNAYNEKHPDGQLTYGQILQRYVLEPAGVANFSAEMPENGCTNPQDLVAPHIAGSPAGGYWTDAESLSNFGSWLCDKWQEPEFQRLTKEYGQEFYYPKSKMLGHGGSIESSCAYLQAFVETGIVYAGLSNQPINTHVIASGIESQVVLHYEKLEAKEKQPQVQAGNLNATQEQELGNAPVKKTIAIFAPSRGSDDPKYLAEIEKQKDFIKSSGFDVDCPDDLIKPPIKGDWHNEWANTKEERARRIINILNNPEVGTMWATNGGESAIEVVNLLDEYDKNPEEIKKQIVDSYLKTHPELPENFFLPERRDLFDYSKGALPKRGIYCVGMSDVSGINNFLGQRGIISPLYADGLLFPDIKRSEDILKTLSDEKKTSEYSELTLLSEGEFVSKEPLEVYATVDGWIASSCGTNFQFALQKPSILAVESIEEGNVVGLTLQQAFEAGALENVKAIAIGRIKGGQVGGDLEKYPALKEFVEKSGIAVFTTNGNLETGENTFGHGRGGITEPFTNFANTSLTKQENGSYSLKISGSRSQENLDFYYQSRESAANKVKVFSDHKKTNGNISIKSKSLQTLSGNGKQELNGSEIIHANYRELRLTNGTERQINLNDKVLLVSGNDGSDGELSFLHQSLVENHLSGSLSGAKAVIIAIPFYPKLSTVGTLKTMTDPNIPYEIDEQGNYLINSFHKRVYDNFLKNDLDKIGSDALKYGFESKGFDEKGDEIGVVKIIIQDEARIEEARRDRYENHLDLFREMFADAASSYLPNTPVYLASDDKLVKNVNEGIGSGKLLVAEKYLVEKLDAAQKRRIDALDLALPNKPSPSPEKSYAEKMVGTSRGGASEYSGC